MENKIRQDLFAMQDLKYKEFHGSLCPDMDNIIGVRIPKLREYAKELYKNNNLEDIKIEDKYYEELVIQGMLIGFQIKRTKKYQTEMFKVIKGYLKSKQEYEVRFAIVMLLDYYINDQYIDQVLQILNNIKLDKYYVQMANAWTISICLIKYYNKTLEFLKTTKLDDFTYNKGIQKAIESYRITKEQKDYLKTLKRGK